MNNDVIKRSPEEIDALLNACADAEEEGGNSFSERRYEQGIKEMYEWLTNPNATYPLE